LLHRAAADEISSAHELRRSEYLRRHQKLAGRSVEQLPVVSLHKRPGA
jgi:hypothetical protein